MRAAAAPVPNNFLNRSEFSGRQCDTGLVSAGEPITSINGKSDPDVSVVICAYTEERWDEIVAAVESVQAQDGPRTEIALIIDHNEALGRRARDHFGETIRIVDNTHKRGLSGARNTGVDATTAPIIVFLDDDAKGKDGWLRELTAPFEDENVCGTGGQVDPLWEVSQPGWWPDEFNWVVGCSYKGLPETRRPIRNPIGANMAVRRSAMEQAGSFNSAVGRVGKHPVGGEETELFIRIKQRVPNAVCLHIPTARVDHRVTAVRATTKYFFHRCFAEGISKAVISQLAGVDDGLSSERTYTTVALPKGVLRNLRQGVKGDRVAFGRAGAIVGGLLVTTAGYLRGRLAKAPERQLAEVPKPGAAA